MKIEFSYPGNVKFEFSDHWWCENLQPRLPQNIGHFPAEFISACALRMRIGLVVAPLIASPLPRAPEADPATYVSAPDLPQYTLFLR